MQSLTTQFANQFADFLQQYIFPELSRVAGTKGCVFTVEEMAKACQMPLQSPRTVLPMSHMGFNVSNPSSNPSSSSILSSSKGVKKQAPPGEGCTYVFVRGKHKNELCNQPRVDNTLFCRNCKDKKGAGGSGTRSSKGEEGGSARAPTNGAPTFATDGGTLQGVPDTRTGDRNVVCEPFGNYEDIGHEPETGLILRMKDGEIWALGLKDKSNPESCEILEHTEQSRKLAASYKYLIPSKKTDQESSNTKVPPGGAPIASVPLI